MAEGRRVNCCFVVESGYWFPLTFAAIGVASGWLLLFSGTVIRSAAVALC